MNYITSDAIIRSKAELLADKHCTRFQYYIFKYFNYCERFNAMWTLQILANLVTSCSLVLAWEILKLV